MPDLIGQFDPQTSGAGTINVGTPNPLAHLKIVNESICFLSISVPLEGTYLILPFTVDVIPLQNPTQSIDWRTIGTLASSGAPVSQVYIVRYPTNERINGTYPLALPRITNIGGGSVAINNGFPSGISFPPDGASGLGQIFDRTDRLQPYILVATGPDRWLSLETDHVTWSDVRQLQPIAASGMAYAGLMSVANGLPQIRELTQRSLTQGINNSTNYWTITTQLRNANSGTLTPLTSFTTQGQAINSDVAHGPIIDYACGLGDIYIEVDATPTGAPSALQVYTVVGYKHQG